MSPHPTTITFDGETILLNGLPTYAGRRDDQGRRIEGLLFNSRMIQGIFDDSNPATSATWAYPDTGHWDPDRNTDEFCAALPNYAAQGVLGVTVGCQGGGSVFAKDIYDHYRNSAFFDDGSLDPAYLARLARVLAAADAAGVVVIVSYFYWKQENHLSDSNAVPRGIEAMTNWLLATEHRNVIVEVANEVGDWFHHPELKPDGIHHAHERVRAQTRNGRRLLVGSSTLGGQHLPTEPWVRSSDLLLPHGNGLDAAGLDAKLRALRARPDVQERPMPIIINEDSSALANLETAVNHGVSWGYYHQGNGSR
jgi:hypothetical protein